MPCLYNNTGIDTIANRLVIILCGTIPRVHLLLGGLHVFNIIVTRSAQVTTFITPVAGRYHPEIKEKEHMSMKSALIYDVVYAFVSHVLTYQGFMVNMSLRLSLIATYLE
jgi:hypothetical protein